MLDDKTLPLTGFSKISYEEFLGMLNLLKLFSSLDACQQDIIMLLMDGLKHREQQANTSLVQST